MPPLRGAGGVPDAVGGASASGRTGELQCCGERQCDNPACDQGLMVAVCPSPEDPPLPLV